GAVAGPASTCSVAVRRSFGSLPRPRPNGTSERPNAGVWWSSRERLRGGPRRPEHLPQLERVVDRRAAPVVVEVDEHVEPVGEELADRRRRFLEGRAAVAPGVARGRAVEATVGEGRGAH